MRNLLLQGKFYLAFYLLSLTLISQAQQNKYDLADGILKSRIIPAPQSVVLTGSEYYTHGDIVTHPKAGPNGADISIPYDNDMYGINFNADNLFGVVTKVTIPDNEVVIDSVKVYGYQTGSGLNSTFYSGSLVIYDQNPMEGGEIIWGDLNANIMTDTYWTGVYRSLNFSDTDRPLMAIVMSTDDLVLPESGEYWFRFGAKGTTTSGPWTPPIAAGQDLQYNAGWEVERHQFAIDIFASQFNGCPRVNLVDTYFDNEILNVQIETESPLVNIQYGMAGFAIGEGIVINNVNPEFSIENLQEQSNYELYTQTICENGELSEWSLLTNISTNCGGESCELDFQLIDSFGDGWNGNKIHIYENGTLKESLTLITGSLESHLLSFCKNAEITVEFEYGSFTYEASVRISTSIEEELYNINFSEQYNKGEDLIFINRCTNCQQSIELLVNETTTNSAEMTWTPGEGSQSWKLEYGAPGFIPGTGNEIITDHLPYTLTGLEENTIYSVYLSSVCENDETSYACGPFYLKTKCSANCNLILELHDSFGDGWNGNELLVYEDGFLIKTVTIEAGSNHTDTIAFCEMSDVQLVFDRSSWSSECSLSVFKEATQQEIYSFGYGEAPSSGEVLSFINFCGNCEGPVDLTSEVINSSSVQINWSIENEDEQYLILYGEEGFNLSEGNQMIVEGNQVEINQLTGGRTYNAYIQPLCANGFFGEISDTVSFTLPCNNFCAYQFNLQDSWGDGWNGNKIVVWQSGVPIDTLTILTGSRYSQTLELCNDNLVEIELITGSYLSECSLEIIALNDGSIVYEFATGSSFSNNIISEFTTICTQCFIPELVITNVSSTQAVISWNKIDAALNYYIEIGAEGFTPGNGEMHIVDDTTLVLEDLARQSSFDVYINSVCADNEIGDLSFAYYFQTICANQFAFAGPDNRVCPHTQSAFSLSGSESGLRYDLLLNDDAYGLSAYGTGGAISFLDEFPEGTYSVLVSDNESSCQVLIDEISIIEKFPELSSQATVSDTILCHDNMNGGIEIHASELNLQYSIDDGVNWQSDSVFHSLNANSYHTCIKDENGCIHPGDTIQMGNPDEILINSVVTTKESVQNTGDAALIITAEGGTGELYYSIDNGETWTTSNGFAELTYGDYMVMVKDENGCLLEFEENPVTIDYLVFLENFALNENLVVYPNPTSGQFFIKQRGFTKDMDLRIYNAIGQIVFEQKVKPEDAIIPVNIEGKLSGSYLIEINSGDKKEIKNILLK